MNKKLEELSLEEWGEFFPIEMAEHNSNWASIFESEKKLIENKLGNETVLRIEHFGSTSIPNLKAKDIIDILIEIPNKLLFDQSIIDKMMDLGYQFFRQPGFGIDYMIFVKGFHTDGKKSQKFFAHMTIGNHPELWERLYFRDYLKTNSKIVGEYEKLKCKLAEKHSKNRIEYRIAKTDFVKEITETAKKACL